MFLQNNLKSLPAEQKDELAATQITLFMENQGRACIKGWAKASTSVRKRLLREENPKIEL